ncbi:MAG TPA: DnaJ domain-containing protein [Bryobacteraceae bacterium]|jgi:hypothetical protein|nr:DnaJ domain-containing protein [Bryobacteraceae bacterium]
MSSPLAGKFQDHYSILNVDAKATSEVIQQAYSKLAEKYRPDNPETGDFEKFESVNLAYEVLSDGNLRREFDKLKGLDQDPGFKFTGSDFFPELSRGVNLRLALLCVLYDRRRLRPFTPSLAMRQLENMLETTSDELNFALWYLKQRGLVAMDDKSSLQITVEGMDFLEANQPSPESVLPLIKADAIAAGKAPTPVKKVSNAVGSVRNALHSAALRR